MKIDICLATYNGAPWIDDFLNSLDAQTYQDWRLLVSDDASIDNTLELIKSHFKNRPDKLLLVQRTITGEGVIKNFQDALDASSAHYILLADQDDVWLPEKLMVLHARMREIEQDRKIPALVFSDLEVVDDHLNTVNKSWWAFMSVKPDWAMSFKGALYQNIVPGCAMMLNRSLLKMTLPLPKGIIMHDWWFLLVCSVFGNVGFCNEKLVRYRRHAEAHTYLDKGGIMSTLRRQWGGRELLRKQYAKTVMQAQVFELFFQEKMDAVENGRANCQVLHDYIAVSNAGWWRRRWLLMKNGIHLTSVFRTFRFYIWI